MVHTQTQNLSFHWADYLVFAASLSISLGIGIFFFIYNRNKASTEQFLMGGRNMNPISVGFSIVASLLNAAFLIGAPAEIHYKGIMYSLMGCSLFITTLFMAHLFIPLYRRVMTTSAYKYIGIRFNSVIAQVLSALAFCIFTILFMAVLLYAPSLAFAQVTGINIHMIQVVCGLVCTVYVFLGGLKAVIWTDTVQMVIIIFGTLAIAFIGVDKVGGASEVWRIANEGNRMNFDVTASDPTKRHTIWTQLIGQVFIYLPMFASNQMLVQRYLAVKSTRHAQIAVYIACFMALLILMLVVICGLVMFAYFRECDPYAIPGHRKITRGDQAFPLLLMELLGQYPGLPGLYTSAVFAGALSSISSVINSLSAVVLEDFVKPIHQTVTSGGKMEDKTCLWISKCLSLFFGVLTIALSYVAPYMGDSLIQIPTTISGVTAAPLFGVFVLAFFFPCANAIGAMTGLIISLAFAFWLAVGGIYFGRQDPVLMPLGANCDALVNVTNGTTFAMTTEAITTVAMTTENMWTTVSENITATTKITEESSIPPGLKEFYSISYAWYGLINLVICIVVGLLVSCITDGLAYGCKEKTSRIENKLLYDCGSKCCCYCPARVQMCFNCYAKHEPHQAHGDSTLEKQGSEMMSNGKNNPAYTPESDDENDYDIIDDDV